MKLSVCAYSLPGVLVEYMRPTAAKGARWRATLTRGSGGADRFRCHVPYQEGPDAAVEAVLQVFNADEPRTCWTVVGTSLCLGNGEAYAYPVGPEA